ncbi:MAG TPA: hypothetical protein VK468_10910, partial [Pyrinomonadaceae bacterium]|nr:hypothetical protein [Pyrinomonadaceae bacterium]
AETVMNYSPLELIWDGLDAASQKVISNSYDDRSERLLKEPADARSDIYSLGATLYHLVTGRLPVDPLERSIELLDGNPDPLKPPHKVDPKIPVELSEVLMRSLEIKRENRFDSAVIMRQVVRTAMVRVREREAEELREQEEAAEDIRNAEQMRQAHTKKLAETEANNAAAERHRTQETLEAQLREVEAQKLLAEQRASEVERLLRDTEAAAKLRIEQEEKAKADAAAARAQAEADAVLKELKEDLLDIDSDTSRDAQHVEAVEVKAISIEPEIAEVPIVEEPEPAALQDIEPAIDEIAEVEPVYEPEHAEVVAYESVSAAATVNNSAVHASVHSSVSDEIDLGGMFSEKHTEAKKGLPMAAIAGIAGVLLLLAIGGWFVMSSGSSAKEPAAVAQPVVTAPEPAPQTTEPETQIESSRDTVITPAADPSAVQVSAGEASPQTHNTAAAQTAAPKVKKPAAEPAKPVVEKKKAVTVDDLIGDN